MRNKFEQTKIENTELPAEYREKIEGSQADFQERLREGMEYLHSSVFRENVERHVIDQTPIIHETVKKWFGKKFNLSSIEKSSNLA